MTIHACTIIARNYLPAARVLARSFREHHPEGRLTALLLDDVYREVDDEAEPFEVRHLEELPIDEDELLRMAAIYDVMEFATAVKPWLLKLLFDEGSATAIYLDPDIRIYAPLDDLELLTAEHGIVLTPHVINPMPRDGLSTAESDILASGIYNLGFAGVRSDQVGFLAFWMERLSRECIVDITGMRFVDQRWIDFVPGLFNVHILRDASYNVAYWNLDHRHLRFEDGRYTINDSPLKFFHFSGFDLKKPHLLSKHQGAHPRILLSSNSALAQICDEYRMAIIAEGGGLTSAASDYALGRLPGGMPLDRVTRNLYRDWLVESEANGAPPPLPPFSAEGAEAFFAYLVGPPAKAGGAHPLSRYLTRLHEIRPDVRAAFPDPAGGDNERFWQWVADAVENGQIDARLAVPHHRGPPQPATGASPSRVARDVLRPGIRVSGYLRAESGVGQHGRLAAEAVRRAGIEGSTFVYSETVSRQDHPFSESGADDLNVNLVNVNADMFPGFVANVGSSFFEGRYTIALWAWELEQFPPTFSGALSWVDEVWGNSTFTRDAIAAVSHKPTFAFPLPIVAPRVPEGVGRKELGLPDRFMFLFCFDMLSIFERKNPIGVVSAFTRAFGPDEGPVLVIKVINGDRRIDELEQLKMAAARRPDVFIWDGYLDAETNAALMATCDCYVSLHRSEGFGLTMAEAMALGKPVIATAYSGNMDFMDEETAFLVPWVDGTIPKGCEPYPAGARWAEPDLDAASRLMRRVIDDPEGAADVARRGQRLVEREHGLAARAEFIKQRFEHAQQILGLSRQGSDRADGGRLSRGEVGGRHVGPAAAVPADLPSLAMSRAPLDSPSEHPRLVKPVRRVVGRLVQHQDDHRRAVDARLAADLLQLTARFDRLEARLGHVEEAMLAELGRVDASLRAVAQRLDKTDHERRRDIDLLVADRGWIADLRLLDAELHATPYMSDPSGLRTVDERGAPAIGFEGGGSSGGRGAYAGFEDVFRGPEDFIRERQEPYVELVSGHAPVVDLGCGRGEFLDLLRAAGIKAWGVDMDPQMAQLCQAKGHDVVESDVVSYLEGEADESIGAIFSAQLIEHLSDVATVDFLRQAQRVLHPDGILIVETVNPHSLAAFKTFWTDLTHRVPIFPEVATVMCRQAGFDRAIVFFPNGTGSLEDDRRTQGEYAVIARKGPVVERRS